MGRLTSYLKGYRANANRHARESAKPILAGIVAGKIVQSDPGFIELLVVMIVVFFLIVASYEIFELLYGRPDHVENEDERMNMDGPAS